MFVMPMNSSKVVKGYTAIRTPTYDVPPHGACLHFMYYIDGPDAMLSMYKVFMQILTQ